MSLDELRELVMESGVPGVVIHGVQDQSMTDGLN